MADGNGSTSIHNGDDAVSSMTPFIVASGVATVALGAASLFVLNKINRKYEDDVVGKEDECETSEQEPLDRTQYPSGYLNIFFGSQTGTAQEFGKELQSEAAEYGFMPRLIDLEDVPMGEGGETESFVKFLSAGLEGAVVGERAKSVFLVATYGEGEATDNARMFVEHLKGLYSSRDENSSVNSFLEFLDFSVFGLGNTEYEHFNAMGKLFNKLLPKFGAHRVAELGLGNDEDDIEGDFQSWKDEKFWPAMKKQYSARSTPAKTPSANGHTNALPKCKYDVEYIEKVNGKIIRPDIVDQEDINSFTRHYFTSVDCPVKVVRELRNESDEGSTVHIEIDISDDSGKRVFDYVTADNLAVLPVNNDSDVRKVAGALGYNLDDVFRLRPSPKNEKQFKHIFPTPCSIRECLERYCDLTMAPRRSELKALAQYAQDPMDKKALLRMASKEGKKEYKEKIVDAHLGLADILTSYCKSIRMPLEHFIDICPRLLPRYYTISSSSSVHPNSVHITVAVLEKSRLDGSAYRGVCSSHLASIVPSGKSTCRVFCRDSTFRLPEDPSNPIIMVGPGTGIAPMRALLQERSYQRNTLKKNVGDSILYFGCKNRNQDYIYADELESFVKEGTLSSLYLAFSREKNDKVYVQHLLKENAENTWKLINDENASVYVCGGTKMGQDVVQTLKAIFRDIGKKSEDEAHSYLKKLEEQKRLVQELWS